MSALPRHLLLVLFLLAPACTTVGALTRTPPDYTNLRPGASRAQVEAMLGQPASRVSATRGAIEDIYVYYTKEESGYVAAVSNFFEMVFTLGWSEVSHFFSGEPDQRHRLRILYDGEDKVVSIKLEEGQGDGLYYNQFNNP